MQINSKYRLFALCGILAFGLVTAGCDGDNSKLSKNNSGGKNADVVEKNDDHDTKSPDPDEDTKSPGPGEVDEPDVAEEADVQATPGLMNGAWRVEATEDNALITYFDLTHLEGNPAVQGNFLTGDGLYEGLLDGGDGQLAESSFDGTTLTIQWNPTGQDTEMLTLSATKVDDDTFDGEVTAVQNVELELPVKVTREEEGIPEN